MFRQQGRSRTQERRIETVVRIAREYFATKDRLRYPHRYRGGAWTPPDVLQEIAQVESIVSQLEVDGRPLCPVEFEFTPEQNALFRDLAGKMRFVGIAAAVIGMLNLLRVFAGDHQAVINGIIFLLSGVWTGGAAMSFRLIADTKDVNHLMNAVGELRKLYRLYYFLVILLALAVLLVALIYWIFAP
jgi:hypothetical protein